MYVDLSDCKICLERSPFCHHERSLRVGGQQSSGMVLSLGECQLVSVWVERPLDSMRIWDGDESGDAGSRTPMEGRDSWMILFTK